ncbi:MAG: hypothetical protein ACKOYL_01740 [Actinomycetota bacterium]
MRTARRLIAVCGLITILVLAACAEDGTRETTPTEPADSVAVTTTTTEPPTFCGVAKIYATEVVDALENKSNQAAEDSPMNTRAFWERYKELQERMRDLAPPAIKDAAETSFESAMAAYDYMEQFTFSMKLASEDPSFANDERFTGEKYLKAGVAFQNYIDENCDIELTK